VRDDDFLIASLKKINRMPELPEVQTTVDGINLKLKGLKIVDVWTDYFSKQYQNQPQIKNKKFFSKFRKEIIGSKVVKAERRAKNILIRLSNDRTILIHMKMTGHLLYGKYRKVKIKDGKGKIKEKWESTQENGPLRDDSYNQYIHLVFTLSNSKHLALSDVRKFAKVTLLKSEGLKNSAELSHLGPEPLDKNFTSNVLKTQLMRRPYGKIKQVLMDQGVVAGIGNIYSDEILWSSNIHPLTPTSALSDKQIKILWKNTRNILSRGIDFGGDSMSDYRNIEGERGKFQLHHKAYRETGTPCLKKDCEGTIKRIVVGGRSTHFCPIHQILL